MITLTFATGNYEKFENGRATCAAKGLTLIQEKVEIDEIQGEDSLKILEDKLQKTYALLQKPVIVSDDSWEIPALNGFPGPYMKSINHWFTVDDYLNLMRDHENRVIYLIQRLGFTDGSTSKSFYARTRGEILREGRGGYGGANHKVIAIDGDDGKTIAEVYDQGLNHNDRGAAAIWHEFLNWYLSKRGE